MTALTPSSPGVGLGLRKDIPDFFLEIPAHALDFVELAPENWMGIGGAWRKYLTKIADRFPLSCHGLSLSLGSPEELNWQFLRELKAFFSEYPIRFYSEHLSFASCDNAHLYDLLPLPFTQDAARHVGERIARVQDFLQRRIAIENVSYYVSLCPEMSEADFICRVLEQADCDLLLDVNNVYVNSVNHGYDPKAFILQLPLTRVRYLHMAGHKQLENNRILDTHGEAIADPVWELFSWIQQYIPSVPTLLERDNNFSDMNSVLDEVRRLRELQLQVHEVPHAA